MVEGTIGTWKAAEGSHISKGDVIMEYENEKNMIDYEALTSGILHILAQEGDTVKVGDPIGIMAESQAEYEALVKGGAASAPAPEAAPAAAGSVPSAGVVEIEMPRAGLTMVEGTITEWKVAEGTQVSKGQTVMEYENEKNSIAYEIVHGGFLHIVAQEGETVKVGAPIAYVTDTKEQYDQLVSGGAPAAAAEPEEKGCARNCPTCVHSSTVPDAAPVKDRISASGLAKKMAKEAGIDLAAVAPTGGPNGRRIVAKDIEAYLKNAKPAEAVSAAPAAASDADEVTAIPWVGVRKTIARNMFNSMQQMAQSTCVCEVDATELLALRAELVADQDMLGCKITVNDLLCKMLGKVLPRHPLANATFDGKTLYTHKHVHLSVAVGAEDGLMVPVVKNVDQLSLCEISKKVRDLAARAKSKSLLPDEQSGGTCTITNVGMFPIDIGTPVINPPQTVICGFGRTVRRAVIMMDDTIAPRSMMNVFLTFDHQVLDGLEVGRILKDIQYYIEHPEMILA
mgnify:CR=1 FL=1